MELQKTKTLDKLKPLLVYALVILVPVIMTSLLLRFSLNTDIFHFHPLWTDEVDYWMQINSFKEHGFASGNYTINELTSSSNLSHYGTHGPVYPMMMGLLARVFGWVEYSAPIYNLVFLCLSMLLFLWLVKPDLKQCLYLILIQIFFYMLLLYVPTMMQESLHFALAILYAGLFIRLFVFQDSRPLIYAGLFTLVFFASLLRIIWVFAAFPVFYQLFTQKSRRLRWVALSLLASVLFSLLSAVLYMYWTSPYPAGNLYVVTQMGFSFSKVASVVKSIVVGNLYKLVSFSGLIAKTDVSIRYTYMVIMVVLLLIARKKTAVVLSSLFVMFSTLTMTILIYDVGNFRILTPYLLIGLFVLVFVAEQRLMKNLITLYVIMGLLTRQQFVKDFQTLIAGHFGDARITAGQPVETGLDKVKYLENANPWCNSILTSRIYSPSLLKLPAGIGTNVMLSLDETNFSVQSHYLLVPQEFLEKHGLVTSCEVLQRYDKDVLCVRTNDGCE